MTNVLCSMFVIQQHYSQSGRQLIGSLNAASNITGVLTDTLSFSALLHKYGALSFWDFASAAPYVKMDMNPLVVRYPCTHAHTHPIPPYL